MRQLRSIGVLLVCCLALAIGCALLPAHRAGASKLPARGAAAPVAPAPLSIDGAQDAQPVRASLDSYSPVAQTALPARPARGFVNRAGNANRPPSCPDFGPLYRRPPPSFS